MIKLFLIITVLLFSCTGKQDTTTIEFWQFWSDPKAKPVIESAVNQFERENPDWKVNITDLTWSDGHQKIVVAFGADNPPDLLELGSDWIAEFAAGNALSKIAYDTSKYFLTEPGIFEDNIYAKPWFLASRIFYFNKSLLDRANVGLPDDWDGLLDACNKIDVLGDDISGFGANSAEPHRLYKKFLPFVWSCGGSIISNGKINLNTPELLNALEYYSKLTKCGQVETQRHLEDAFCEGKVGFLISGGWLYKRLKTNSPSFEYQLVPMIGHNKDATGWSFAGGEYLVIPQKSDKKQAAQKLMNIITLHDNTKALCDSVGFGYPSQKDRLLDESAEEASVLHKQLLYSKSTPVHPRWVYIESIIEEMVEQITLGQMTPKAALKNAQAKIDQALEN